MQKNIINLDPIFEDFGNFTKPEVILETTTGWTPPNNNDCGPCLEIIKNFINSDEFTIPISNYTKTGNFKTLISEITKQVIYFDSEYVIIDRNKIEESLVNITDTPTIYLNPDEMIDLINQAYLLGFITEEQKNQSLTTNTKFRTFIKTDDYKKLLDYQLTYIPLIKRYIPEIAELQTKGLDTHILSFVNDNFFTLLNNNEIFVFEQVETYLNKKYQTDSFISAEKIELIYAHPLDFLKILDTIELASLLDRVKYYLDYLTDSKVNLLKALPDSTNILTYLSINEIKGIIDKEVDLKQSIIKALTLEEINKVFESFKILFVNQDLKPIIFDAVKDMFLLDELTAKTIIKNAIIFAEENKNLNLLQGI